MEIAPSILNADFYCLKKQLDILKKHGIKKLHMDVMDGHFVDNISFAFPVIESLYGKGFDLDTHLMISDPGKYAERFAKYSKIVTVHYETCDDHAKILENIRKNDALAGISLNPDTPAEKVVPLLGKFDLILIMSVFPGYGGQKFIDDVLIKAQFMQQFKSKYGFLTEIDGGINMENFARIKEGGTVDIAVMGSALMNSMLAKNLKILRRYE